MDVTPLVKKGQQIIQKYKSGSFTISGQVYDGPVVVTPDETRGWATQARDVEGLSFEDFAVLADRAGALDVVLLGCGARMAFLPADLKNSLKGQGISLDVMDTGAACRTYNVLMAEGRRVAAALLPVAVRP